MIILDYTVMKPNLLVALGGLSQERIANDVLSLSRLQLDTLSIHSVDFQVWYLLSGAFTMTKLFA